MKAIFQKRIFIVDADPAWNQKMAETLANLGFTNVTGFKATTGCIKQLHLKPELIFLDYEVKAIEGLEFLMEAKKYFHGVGIVFCTAKKDHGLAVKAAEGASFDFLIKQEITEKKVASVLDDFFLMEEPDTVF